jgi:O-antigen/teichoic acid export membrane protein
MMNVSSLFLTAAQPLMVREMSIAAGNNDPARMAHLYQRFYPLLFALTAYFSVFICMEADDVISIFGGEQYASALWTFRLVMMLPLISVFSGLNAAIIYSTQRTKLFLIMGAISAPFGAVLLYVLLSPHFLNLGAIGLAIKTFTFELLSASILTVIISRTLKIKATKCLRQIVFLVTFFAAAFLAKGIVLHLVAHWGVIPKFTLSGMLYTALVAFCGWFYPTLLGVAKEDVQQGKTMIRTKLGL